MSDFEEIQDKTAQGYLHAVALYDKEEFDACCKACKQNLTDPTLAPYWTLKNYLLFISAMGDWYDAEEWRTTAEKIYKSLVEETAQETLRGEVVRTALHNLRESLD